MRFERTQRLLGEDAMKKLAASKVAVFGIGGVGGYVCEGLVRSGIGSFFLVDADNVDITNLNRQIIALNETLGRAKVEVMAERMHSINPSAAVLTRQCFYLPENADTFDFSGFDYIVDAVDTVAAKIEIILRAKAAGVPIISAMGAGNHLDASAFRVADIYKTKGCPLAKVMRHELKKRGVKDLKVVYSEEAPLKVSASEEGVRPLPGSAAFCPSVMGMIMAGEIVRDLTADISEWKFE